MAYKKFLESGGKDVETRKQIGSLQKRVRLTFGPFSIFALARTLIYFENLSHHADTLIFVLINARLVSIDWFKSCRVDN